MIKSNCFLRIIITIVTVLGVGLANSAVSAVLKVGSGEPYPTPSAAAEVAENGDVVEIAAETYSADVAVWRQDNLTLRGVGGRAHLKTQGQAAGGKAIWVIQGNNVTIENIEFSGVQVADKNGAGIRFEGTGLTIRNAHFMTTKWGF